jgi:hypothetical protein
MIEFVDVDNDAREENPLIYSQEGKSINMWTTTTRRTPRERFGCWYQG